MDEALTLHALSDEALLLEVKRLAAHERHATAALVCALAVLDARRLYLGEGYPSLFAYATQALGLSEEGAYHRIAAARAGVRFPVLLAELRAGALTLTAITLLAPHLTPENRDPVLAAARHKSRREVERLVATLRPLPDVPASVRKLPTPRPLAVTEPRQAGARRDVTSATEAVSPVLTEAADQAMRALTTPSASAPRPPRDAVGDRGAGGVLAAAPSAHRAVVLPLAPTRYKIQVTVGEETHAKLRRAQDLLRHVIPDGDPAAILDRALTLLVTHLERTQQAARKAKPLPSRATSWRALASGPAKERVPPAAPMGGAGLQGGAGRDGGIPESAASPEGPSVRVPGTAAGDGPTTPDAPRGTGVDARRTGDSPLERDRRARKASRYIPAPVRRAVFLRDGARCTYVGTQGRCPSTTHLQLHHVLPYARGGRPTVENLRVTCAPHNGHQAEQDFGPRARPRERMRGEATGTGPS